MRQISYIVVAITLLFSATNAVAQTIALGERTPRFKKAKWLNGNIPQKCDFTYIEFIHSASAPCQQSAKRIYNIINEFESCAFILISHQSATKIDSWVTAYISPHSGVIIDDDRIRNSFGVNYAPYAVILDHKRRALWFGNPQLLEKQTIEKLINKIKANG